MSYEDYYSSRDDNKGRRRGGGKKSKQRGKSSGGKSSGRGKHGSGKYSGKSYGGGGIGKNYGSKFTKRNNRQSSKRSRRESIMDKEECKYGHKCNECGSERHLKKYYHPCKFGKKCFYLKRDDDFAKLHRHRFFHPCVDKECDDTSKKHMLMYTHESDSDDSDSSESEGEDVFSSKSLRRKKRTGGKGGSDMPMGSGKKKYFTHEEVQGMMQSQHQQMFVMFSSYMFSNFGQKATVDMQSFFTNGGRVTHSHQHQHHQQNPPQNRDRKNRQNRQQVVYNQMPVVMTSHPNPQHHQQQLSIPNQNRKNKKTVRKLKRKKKKKDRMKGKPDDRYRPSPKGNEEDDDEEIGDIDLLLGGKDSVDDGEGEEHDGDVEYPELGDVYGDDMGL